MRLNKNLLFISIIFPLVTLFFDKYSNTSTIQHELGFPIKFYTYFGDKLPISRLEFLNPFILPRINFRIDLYIFSVIVTYLALIVLYSFVFNRILKLVK